jgi:hypothetical protein
MTIGCNNIKIREEDFWNKAVILLSDRSPLTNSME